MSDLSHNHDHTPATDLYGISRSGEATPHDENQFLVARYERKLEIPRTSLDSTDLAENGGELLAVSHGDGPGHLGAVASTIAMRCLADRFAERTPWNLTDPTEEERALAELDRAHFEAHSELLDANALASDSIEATMTAACVSWPDVLISHVGAGRCYLQRGRRISQLTRDHTVAQTYVDRHVVTPREASRSELRKVVWNSAGGSADRPRPEKIRVQLEPGDTLLVCTPEVSEALGESDLLDVVRSNETAEQVCKAIADRAEIRGHGDGLAVTVARYAAEEGAKVRSDEPRDPEALAAAQVIPTDLLDRSNGLHRGPLDARTAPGVAPLEPGQRAEAGLQSKLVRPA